jgi:predicted nucleic acid-binding protein
MPDDRPRIYWDSNVPLSYIDGDEDRLPTIDELLRRSRAREIEIVTSALTQVEVAFGSQEKEDEALDPDIEEKIDELWKPGSPITVVEFYPAVAHEARTLMRSALASGKSGLKPHDAIHLATARRMDVQEVQTYDTRLENYADVAELTIRAPVTPQEQIPGTQGDLG